MSLRTQFATAVVAAGLGALAGGPVSPAPASTSAQRDFTFERDEAVPATAPRPCHVVYRLTKKVVTGSTTVRLASAAFAAYSEDPEQRDGPCDVTGDLTLVWRTTGGQLIRSSATGSYAAAQPVGTIVRARFHMILSGCDCDLWRTITAPTS